MHGFELEIIQSTHQDNLSFQHLGKTKKIIYPSELFFFLYVSLSQTYKKITSSFKVDYFLPLPLPLRVLSRHIE